MNSGETWEDVRASVMGSTAEPRTTPMNSRIQPIDTPEACHCVNMKMADEGRRAGLTLRAVAKEAENIANPARLM